MPCPSLVGKEGFTTGADVGLNRSRAERAAVQTAQPNRKQLETGLE